jgi:hypothetical protein
MRIPHLLLMWQASGFTSVGQGGSINLINVVIINKLTDPSAYPEGLLSAFYFSGAFPK